MYSPRVNRQPWKLKCGQFHLYHFTFQIPHIVKSFFSSLAAFICCLSLNKESLSPLAISAFISLTLLIPPLFVWYLSSFEYHYHLILLLKWFKWFTVSLPGNFVDTFRILLIASIKHVSRLILSDKADLFMIMNRELISFL